MATESGPFYSANFPEVKFSERFETPAGLSEWAQAQRSAWQSVLKIDSVLLPPTPIRSYFDRARSHLQSLFDVATEYANGPTEERRGRLDSAFRNALVESRIPASSTNIAAFLNQLLVSRGDVAAASALASFGPFQRNQPIDTHLPDVRIGTAAAMMFLLGVEPTIPAANADALKELTTEYQTKLAALEDEKRNFQASTAAALAKVATDATELRSKDRLDVDESIATFGESAKTALESFKATEAAYTEQMRLQAAVTYWTEQGAAHRLTEKNVRLWLMGYACIASIGLLFLLNILASYATEAGAGNIVQYVKYAAIGVLATTIAIWIGRLLLRIFLSERHLSIDAEERVTMVKTYLALTKEAKLEASDRPLVLSALFRPGSDGIVRDDASPDTMLGGVLGRALDRMSGKM